MKKEKIAVCITAQSSSQNLIDYGAEIAREYNGCLHILHVQKGDSIFQNGETLKLLTKLLAYGDRCGGIIHVMCDEDVPKCIGQFVREEHITKVIMGQIPEKVMKQSLKKQKETQFQKIISALPEYTEVMIAGQHNTVQTDWEEKIG